MLAIPIRNVYYLLCYAWNRLAEGGVLDASHWEGNNTVDLLARVLSGGVEHLQRRGIEKNYLEHEDEIAGIRGRIDFSTSARRMLTIHGRAYCSFDELSIDTAANRVLKASLLRLVRSSGLDPELRKKLRTHYRSLGDVRDVALTGRAFRSVQLHQNTRFYRLVLSVCKLVMDSTAPDEAPGTYRFRDFVRDTQHMARLFESFVRNFYALEGRDLEVNAIKIRWNLRGTEGDLAFLPEMATDISIRDVRRQRVIVIDTKYYKSTFSRHWLSDKKSIHRDHLFQLFAYLKNLEARGGLYEEAEGILLYPAVNEHVRLTYELPNHRIRVCTVNLAAEWWEIERELLDLLEVA